MSRLYDLIDSGLEACRQNPSLDEAAEVERALTAATGGIEHLVRVTGRDWVMQHPLPERFEEPGDGASLMDCRFNRLVDVAMSQRAMSEGTHRVWIDRGVLQWEEVDRG